MIKTKQLGIWLVNSSENSQNYLNLDSQGSTSDIICFKSEDELPISILPALPLTDQIELVKKSIDTLQENSVLRIVKKILANFSVQNFETLGNHLSFSIHVTKHYLLAERESLLFILTSEIDVFHEKRINILGIIKNKLELRTKWVIYIAPNGILLFTLTSPKGLLIWSLIHPQLQDLLIASVIVNPTLLNAFSYDYRWMNHEKTQNLLSKSLKMWIKQNKRPTTREKLYFFQQLYKEYIETHKQIIEEIEEVFPPKCTTNSDKEDSYSYYPEKLDTLLTKTVNITGNNTFSSFYSVLRCKAILNIHPIHFLQLISTISEKNELRSKGEYYTPLKIAEALAGYLVADFDIENSFKTNIRVFDPSMGSGILLVCVLETLANRELQAGLKSKMRPKSFLEIRKHILQTEIFGIDTDEVALTTGKSFLEFFCQTSLNSFSNFLIQDFLGIRLDSSIFQRKFDIIISNPPFLSQHSRFSKKFLSDHRMDEITEIIPHFTIKRVNAYTVFLGLCLQHFSESKGLVGFIIDQSLLDLASYRLIRRHLLRNYSINRILTNIEFENVAVDIAIIIIQNKSPDSNDEQILWHKSLSSNTLHVPIKHFLNQPHFSLYYKEFNSVLQRILNQCINLGEITEISCGLEYGSMLKSNFLASTPQPNYYPVLDGSNNIPRSNILFWVSNCPNSYVRYSKDYEKYLIDTKQNYKNGKKVLLISGDKKRFIAPKIVLRQSATEFIAVYDEEGYYALRNLHLIYAPNPPYTLHYLLGILTSQMGRWIGEQLNIIRKQGRNRYPQIRITDLKTFPIIPINERNDECILKKKIEDLMVDVILKGQEIALMLKKLWEIFHNEKLGSDPPVISQRRFTQLCLCKNEKIFTFIPQKERTKIDRIAQLALELSRLEKIQNSYVRELYLRDS